jgi:hypothetical protein
MPSFHPLAPPHRLPLTERLDRLRQTLNGLSGELVEGVAASIAQTVAGVVRDTLLALLTKGRSRPDLPERDRSRWSHNRPSSLWGGLDEGDDSMWPEDHEATPMWGNPDEDRWPDSPSDRRVPVTPTQPSTAQPRLRRWVSALAASWQAAGWWLARKPGRYPVMTALAIGLAAGVATWAGGPLAAAGMTLIGTAVGLVSLAQAAGSGAVTVAGILSS